MCMGLNVTASTTMICSLLSLSHDTTGLKESKNFDIVSDARSPVGCQLRQILPCSSLVGLCYNTTAENWITWAYWFSPHSCFSPLYCGRASCRGGNGHDQGLVSIVARFHLRRLVGACTSVHNKAFLGSKLQIDVYHYSVVFSNSTRAGETAGD